MFRFSKLPLLPALEPTSPPTTPTATNNSHCHGCYDHRRADNLRNNAILCQPKESGAAHGCPGGNHNTIGHQHRACPFQSTNRADVPPISSDTTSPADLGCSRDCTNMGKATCCQPPRRLQQRPNSIVFIDSIHPQLRPTSSPMVGPYKILPTCILERWSLCHFRGMGKS